MMTLDTRIITASSHTEQNAPIAVPPGPAMWEALKELVVATLVHTGSSEVHVVKQIPAKPVVPWVRPAMIDPAQAWFWTPGWLEGEAAVNAELEVGESQIFINAEDFLADLDN